MRIMTTKKENCIVKNPNMRVRHSDVFNDGILCRTKKGTINMPIKYKLNSLLKCFITYNSVVKLRILKSLSIFLLLPLLPNHNIHSAIFWNTPITVSCHDNTFTSHSFTFENRHRDTTKVYIISSIMVIKP